MSNYLQLNAFEPLEFKNTTIPFHFIPWIHEVPLADLTLDINNAGSKVYLAADIAYRYWRYSIGKITFRLYRNDSLIYQKAVICQPYWWWWFGSGFVTPPTPPPPPAPTPAPALRTAPTLAASPVPELVPGSVPEALIRAELENDAKPANEAETDAENKDSAALDAALPIFHPYIRPAFEANFFFIDTPPLARCDCRNNVTYRLTAQSELYWYPGFVVTPYGNTSSFMAAEIRTE